MAKSMILWGTFQGNSEAFDAAVAAGDLIQQGNMYFWAEVASGRNKSQVTGMKASGGELALNAEEFSTLGSFMESRPFTKYGMSTWDAALASLQAPSNPSSGSRPELSPPLSMFGTRDNTRATRPQAIEDASRPKDSAMKWNAVENMVAEAKAAQERLLRDASRYAAKTKACKDDNVALMLKEAIALLNGTANKLQECQMWQDCPHQLPSSC